MGKYILLITASVGIGTSLYAYQSQRTSLEETRERAERQKEILARQIARSAFATGFSGVKREFKGGEDRCRPYEGGSFELTTTLEEDAVKGEDIVTVRATGWYGVEDCTCTDCPRYVIVAQASQKHNAAFSGVTVDGSLNSVNLQGNAGISGNDEANVKDRYGVSLSEEEGVTEVKEECGGSVTVEGAGEGDCDVVHDPDIDLEPLHSEVDNLGETHDETDLCGGGKGKGKGKNKGKGQGKGVGNAENPAVVKIENDCHLSGNSGGTGILYVEDGSLTMTGNSQWNGLILVGDGGGEVQTSKGTPQIEGGMAFYGGGTLDMRGTPDVQFNSDYLKNLNEKLGLSSLQDLLDSPVSKEVQMADRRGCIPQGDESCP